MGIVSPGFTGRPRREAPALPPGQYLTDDFPVLSAGPTPRVTRDAWEFTVVTETGTRHRWSWVDLLALPAETLTVDIHCVTKWSKLGTTWEGVPVATLLDGVDTTAEHVVAWCDGGYTTNVPLEDLLGRAWVAYEYGDEPLEAVHGGPARLLVPH